MATISRWMEAKVVELGSVQAAYDKFYGEGSYAYLKWNAEDGDPECVEEIEFLHACWGEINNETLVLNFL
jgi:hypothetical protein